LQASAGRLCARREHRHHQRRHVGAEYQHRRQANCSLFVVVV
jgi:hypothetical protein